MTIHMLPSAACVAANCTSDAFIDEPVSICRQHALMLSRNVSDRLHANALAASESSDMDLNRATTAPDDVWTKSSHQPIVYFMVNGDRVKIGVSTNITARVSALCLRRSNVAMLLVGGYEMEAALHAHFAADRIGQSEWFYLSRSIQDYMQKRLDTDRLLRQPVLDGEGIVEPKTPFPTQSRRQRERKRHPRREQACTWVQQAGSDGISVVAVRDRLSALYPSEVPPSDTAIQNWYATHPNITKPGRGVYYWSEAGE